MNTFLGCISSNEGVLFFGPLIMLIVLEVALCITYIKECKKLGLLSFRKVNRRREEALDLAVSDV